MAIKLPRYTSNLTSSPVTSNRSITTGVVENPIGEGMMNLAKMFGDAQIRREAKLRDLDLTSKNENGKNDSLLHNDDFTFKLQTSGRSDWQAWEDEYKSSYQTNVTEKKLNGEFKDDEVAWKKHEPFNDLGYIEGLRAVRQLANTQRLKNAQRAYDQSWINTQSSIDKAQSAEEVKSHYDTWATGTLGSYAKTEFIDGQRYKTDGEGMLAYANNAYLFHQANKGVAPLQAPNGSSAIDWAALANKAADPNFEMTDVRGNPLTVDDPLRKGLIKHYRDKDSEQDTFFERERIDRQRESKGLFSDRIIRMATGQQDATFLTDLEKDTRLEPETKIALKNAYFTNVSNLKDKTKPWETPQGIAAEGMLRVLISTGVIDTEEEKSIINDMFLNGQLISPAAVTSLAAEVDKKIASATKPDMMLYKRAVGVILKEMGEKPNPIQAIAGLQAGSGQMNSLDDVRAFVESMSGQLSEEAFMAIQNLDRMIAEGQRKGFSTQNMLGNVESPNYIVTDLVKVYKGVADDKNLKNFNVKAQQYLNTNWKTDGKYGIDAGAWAASNLRSSPVVVNVPLRRENESIGSYLPRLDKWMRDNKYSSKSNLPLFLQGNQVESGANVNIIGTE